MDEFHKPNRKERRAAEAKGDMTDRRFMEIADKFIDWATECICVLSIHSQHTLNTLSIHSQYTLNTQH